MANKAKELLKKLERSITTVNLDMGGNHRYAMSHKTHRIITEIKEYIAAPEQQSRYQKYEFCKAIRCCNINRDGTCNTEPSKCLMTAKEFHHWLKDNDLL